MVRPRIVKQDETDIEEELDAIEQAIETILWAYATDPNPDIEFYEIVNEYGLSTEAEDIILDLYDKIQEEGERLYSEIEQRIKETARKIIKSISLKMKMVVDTKEFEDTALELHERSTGVWTGKSANIGSVKVVKQGEYWWAILDDGAKFKFEACDMFSSRARDIGVHNEQGNFISLEDIKKWLIKHDPDKLEEIATDCEFSTVMVGGAFTEVNRDTWTLEPL